MGGPRVTEGQIEKIYAMRKDGFTVNQIASEVSVSTTFVYKLTRDMEEIQLEDDEVVVDINGLDGNYQISNYGRVFSLARGKIRKELKISHHQKKSSKVYLRLNGETKMFCVDQLVAEAFLGSKDDDGQIVKHIDGDYSNNRADNLTWGYPQDKTKKKEKKPLLTDAEIEIVREEWKQGFALKELAEKYNVSQSYIYNRVRDIDRYADSAPPCEDGEVWKSIDGYAGRYKVSNHGRVFSTGLARRKPRIMSPSANLKGYESLSLRDSKGTDKTCPVHRLVALAFCDGHDDEHNTVNHKDGNTSNNFASNLEWCSSKDNTVHAIKVLGKKMGGYEPFVRVSTRMIPKEEDSPVSPLRLFSDDEVRSIRSDIRSSAQLAKIYGVNKSTIQRMRRGETYKNI